MLLLCTSSFLLAQNGPPFNPPGPPPNVPPVNPGGGGGGNPGGGNPGGGGGPTGDCYCWETAIIQTDADSASGCVTYTVEVSHDFGCKHDLSNVSFGVPTCGTIDSVSNSKGYPIEKNKVDPNSHLYGFKIDNVSNFGKAGSDSSFTIVFEICPSDSACADTIACFDLVAGYKAGTCGVVYDTVFASCGINLMTASTPVLCAGDSNGSVSVVASGGTAPYSYLWSTGDTTDTVNGVPFGTYYVDVTDAAGNTASDTVMVATPAPLAVSDSVTDAGCDPNGGAISVVVSGGTMPYSYLWSTGDTLASIDSLAAGIYTLNVTDANGCMFDTSYTVAGGFITGVFITDVTCNGGMDGSISLAICDTGVVDTAFWSNGDVGLTADSLAAGTYIFNWTDTLGGSFVDSFVVSEPPAFSVTPTITNSSCNAATGSISLAVSGGTPPYTYSWSNGDTTSTIDSLSAGSYTGTITDSNGCTASATFTVGQDFFDSATVTDVTCNGGSDGSITIVLCDTGVVDTFTWSNGATTLSQDSIPAGSYILVISDTTGMTYTDTFNVNEPMAIGLSFDISNPTCGLVDSLWSVDLTVMGGTPPYGYLWSNGDTTEDLNMVSSGTYSVVVTDANGCTATDTVDVDSSAIAVDCSIIPPATNPVCNSTGNTLEADTAGITNYLWIVSSTDPGWAITAGQGTSSITYSAGDTNTVATFTLIVGNTNTLCADTCSIVITCDDTTGGSTESNLSQIKLFPNPGAHLMNIEVMNDQDGDLELILMDYNGAVKQVIKGETQLGVFKRQLQVSDLPEGVYLLQLRREGEVQTKRFTIVR